MKQVLQAIFQHKHRYARLPLFDFLRDETRTPRQRLSFLPCMAPFILSFGDLNRYVLRDEPTTDPHQHMINLHTHEDDHHWPWYLEDWARLGHDAEHTAASQVLRQFYSDDTTANRLLMLRLTHLVWNATPTVRLAIVEAIEETGNVLFALTARAAAAEQQRSGLELRYCGEFHFQLESGHAMNNDHRELAEIPLDDATRAQALAAVEQVFGWFEDWTHELLRYALKRSASGIAEPVAAL
jgi:hypothetical protein